jgi:hypothetical protein
MRFLFWTAALVGVGSAMVSACSDDSSTDSYTPATGGSGGTTANVDAGTIYGLALVNPTCGAGDGGTVSNECTSCAADHCSADFSECFGSAWQTDLEGGECSTFGACVMACACGDRACFNLCVDELDASGSPTCRSCLADLVACEQTYCAGECSSASPDGGAGAAGSGGAGAHGSGGH